eukprot:6485541-Amphidinium_carterae.3
MSMPTMLVPTSLQFEGPLWRVTLGGKGSVATCSTMNDYWLQQVESQDKLQRSHFCQQAANLKSNFSINSISHRSPTHTTLCASCCCKVVATSAHVTERQMRVACPS